MTARPPIPAPLWDSIPPEAQAAILAHLASLEQRIADLEAENAELRRRLAQVEHQLQNIRRRRQRAIEIDLERAARPMKDCAVA